MEIVPSRRGARVRFFAMTGHPRTRWEIRARERFTIGPEELRRLKGEIDHAFLAYHPPVPNPDNGETIVCNDGPGYATERMRGERVETLVGFCPPSREEPHPNLHIACAVDRMLSRHLPVGRRPILDRSVRCPPKLSA
ncbi:MAG TPA: hypothetical protein VHM92_03280 [Allosphingosinicella sp.]|nr:hypothetical protein [Allosphingosinicella sp.]